MVMLSDSGAVLGRFAHAGPLTDVSLDAPSPRTWAHVFVVAQGASAARGVGVVAVLDALHIAGRSPEDPRSPYHCGECEPAGPGLRYYEFPRTEVEIAGNLPLENPRGGGYDDTFGTAFPYPFGTGYGVLYYFSGDFERVRVELGDDYWRRHRELESAGRITH